MDRTGHVDRGIDQKDATVRVGSWVRIRHGTSEERWRIVAHEDADVAQGLISDASPLARALLGHKVGDQVHVEGPEGRWPVTVLSVG